MVIKEYWWAGEQSKAIKNLRWARATSGQRSDIFSWLRTQEVVLDRALSAGRLRRTREETRADQEDAPEDEEVQDVGGA
jgi:hypothetical protein